MIKKFDIYNCECGGFYTINDSIWPSRKYCNKCGEYIDLSG